MNWQEFLEHEAEKSAREQRQWRQEEEGEPDEATMRMVKELNQSTLKTIRECQELPDDDTPLRRLNRVMQHEKLVKGLEQMLLCRPLYGDKACDRIQELLRG